MAKVDRKNKENQQGEKHSLSSFEKKRGAKIAFNIKLGKILTAIIIAKILLFCFLKISTTSSM